jgi:hypothetical protein
MAVIIGITLFIPLYAFSEWVVLWYKIIETLGVQYREYKYPLEIVATRYSQRDAIVGGSGDDL